MLIPPETIIEREAKACGIPMPDTEDPKELAKILGGSVLFWESIFTHYAEHRRFYKKNGYRKDIGNGEGVRREKE